MTTRLQELEETRRGLPALDLIVVVAVIGLCSAMQFREASLGMTKAQMFEPVGVLRPAQYEAIERFAEWGTFDDYNAAGAAGVAGVRATRGTLPRRATVIASLRELEEAQASVSQATVAGDAEGGGGNKLQRQGFTIAGISDGVPTATVKAPGMESPLLIEMRPAVQADGAVVNWLCGSRLAPAWLKAKPPRGPAVPDDQLPISCRVTP